MSNRLPKQSNIEELEQDKGCAIFIETVKCLAAGQGAYGRLLRNIFEMNKDSLAKFKEIITEQDFKEPLDVVMFLED